jgi:hypothetical protein
VLHNELVSLFGRDEDIAAIEEQLLAGGVLLVGPRRIGKTELLKQLCRKPPRDTVPVRVDLEGLVDVAGAVERVAESLFRQKLLPQKPFAERLAALKRVSLAGVVEVERGDGAGETAWDTFEEILDAALKRLDGAQRLLLFLDEVPWWLDGLRRPLSGDEIYGEARDRAGEDRVRQALAQLRYFRQRDGMSRRLRMMLTGSVGLSSLAHATGASAELNDLSAYELRPLAERDGVALFEYELASRGVPCTEEASLHAHRLGGGSPHWIKQLAAKIRGRDREATPAEVDAAAEQLLSPRMRHLFQDEAHHHLERRHGLRAPLMRAVLSAASASDPGATRSALVTSGLKRASSRGEVERAIVQLVDDFYLEPEADRFRFANPLFRRWWERYGTWEG